MALPKLARQFLPLFPPPSRPLSFFFPSCFVAGLTLGESHVSREALLPRQSPRHRMPESDGSASAPPLGDGRSAPRISQLEEPRRTACLANEVANRMAGHFLLLGPVETLRCSALTLRVFVPPTPTAPPI